MEGRIGRELWGLNKMRKNADTKYLIESLFLLKNSIDGEFNIL
ncbi:MAG: hypothetical protein UW23_C0024G0004 [Candidatus Collierbacteria bacterium GW2011_GWA1_44_12]|uniref:Uncharacterized protein n=1 Tax=Candidatus Collierbacteria bacterium GW2011_GWA1_44_12 TaxID=1618376 RepID=A0A0G1JI07_9BACT|nr:MAG: hypothetical protein UW23_C0024G0004 [Candidatus Collierbacteria bacterium GW2011_GWA1_44_12]